MKLSKYYMVWVLLLVLMACKNDDDDNNSIPEPEEAPCEVSVTTVADAESIILGEWEWKESKFEGRAGETVLTPSTENETRAYVFKEDKTVQVLVNGEVIEESRYQISTSSNTNQGALALSWTINDQNFEFYMNICPEEMNLTDAVSSLQIKSVYTKK